MAQTARSGTASVGPPSLADRASRVEIIDGEVFGLVAGPLAHQRALGKLFALMRWACASDQEVLLGPLPWVVDDRNVFQPDVLVARRDQLTEHGLHGRPILAVEIVAPSTRARDWELKARVYAQAGLPHYWIVDTDVPSITTFDLLSGRYVERHVVWCHQRLDVGRPFPFVVHPTDLLTPR